MGALVAMEAALAWPDKVRGLVLCGAGQRRRHALVIEGVDGLVDRLVECVGVGEGLVGEMMRLEVAPDGLDVVQFRRVFGQPLDGEPMCAGGERRERELAGVDRAIVLDQHDRRDGLSGPGAIEPVELLEMGDEIAAALGRAGVDDEFARSRDRASPACATFFACPGAGTRKSAPVFAQARAR